jgi:O-succinylbenzoic acid--CoA ligase
MLLHLNSQTYNKEQILLTHSFTDSYVDKTLQFCKSWLAGDNEFIIHTSGSTGTPKPILISRLQMSTSAAMTSQKLGLYAKTKALVCLNTDYIAGKMMLVRGLEHNWELFVVEPSNLPFKDFANRNINIQIDFAALVPTQLQNTIEIALQEQNNDEDKHKISLQFLNHMKAIIVGGAVVSVYLEKLIQKYLTVPVYSTYGMTETVSHIALKRLNGNYQEQYFSLMPNIEITTNEYNCLKIKGVVTQNEWLQTNDLVNLVIDDAKMILGFEWLGRIDNIVNSGGIKILIEKVERKIEELLNEFSLEKRFFVGSLADDFLGEKLILIIEDKQWTKTIETKFMESLRDKLPKYEVPKQVFFINKFIETETKKINRKKNIEIISKKL